MKEKYYQLQDFLFELIDLQIKKYVALAKIGVGPDAQINAALVWNEVTDLLVVSQQINLAILAFEFKAELYSTAFKKIKFYIDQEYLRGRAGWLIDRNNIHNPQFDRLTEQLEQLQRMASQNPDLMQVGTLSDAQLQCEHDSLEIAFLILSLAVQLKEHPDIEIPAGIPKHAWDIMKKHALPNGRYHQDDLWDEITELHQKTQQKLAHSPRKKSTTLLNMDEISLLWQQHQQLFQEQYLQYQKLNPQSPIFAEDKHWYKIGDKRRVQKQQEAPVTFSGLLTKRNLLLFAGSVALVGVSVALVASENRCTL